MYNLIFGMHTINVTQLPNEPYTHKDLQALDLNGSDAGIDYWRAFGFWKCLAKWGPAGTHMFGSCDEFGNKAEVHCADGINRVVTLALTHSTKDYEIGKVYGHKEVMYQEGKQGRATGNHIHIETAAGWQTKKHFRRGQWRLDQELNPVEVIYVLDGYSKVRDTRGAVFRHTASEVYKEEKISSMKEITRINLNDPVWEYRFSLDGNMFGTSYDKTTMKHFSDKKLEEDGWQKYTAVNASIFYSYEGKTYAEGVEKSRGVNNQPLEMDAVKKFKDTMAVGMTYDGKLVFDRQSYITQSLDSFYGAFTGMFGIMKNGQLAEYGKEIEHLRNRMYSNISGRTVVGYSSISNEVILISITGVSGKSGVRGAELFNICKEAGCTEALCCDGGGSVFLIRDGEVIIPSTRAVKNAFLIYRRKRKSNTDSTNTNNLLAENKKLLLEIESLKAEIKALKDRLAKILEIIK